MCVEDSIQNSLSHAPLVSEWSFFFLHAYMFHVLTFDVGGKELVFSFSTDEPRAAHAADEQIGTVNNNTFTLTRKSL
jgi:hypothetical protein